MSDRRIVQQAACDRELLPHAARQLAGQRAPLLRRARARRADGGIRVFDVGDAVQARDEPQMLFDRQILEQVRLVGNERERCFGGDRVARMSWPAIVIVPLDGAMMPASQRSVVVLPAPFGPTRPRISPAATSNEIERRR